MTQTEFDKLPGLISRKKFREVTGLTDRKFRDALAARLFGFFQPPTGYRLYYKRDAAKIGGWTMIVAIFASVLSTALHCGAVAFPSFPDSVMGANVKTEWKELATEKPSLEKLREEYRDAVEQRDRSIFTRQRLNHNARFCIWPNQSADGKKWTAPRGSAVFPWMGASDARVGLVDKYINEDVSFLMVMTDRMRVQVSGTEINDAAFAHRATNLLRWMKDTQMTELARERRLGANYLLERGSAVFGVFWERQSQLGYDSIDLEELGKLASEYHQATQQGQQLPEGAKFVAQLAELVMDPARDDEAVAALGQIFPTVRKPRLGKALNELRENGTTRLPRPYLVKNRPTVVALAPNEEIFLPTGTTELQTARGVYRRELVTETQLTDRVLTHGWDDKWVKEMVRTQRGVVSIAGDSRVLRDRQRITSTGTGYTDKLFEVVHAYERRHDADGVPGIYYTCFNPHIMAENAYHGLLDYDHGQYPFIHVERESRSRLLDDARGYGEVAFTWQHQIKTQWDARTDRASLATLPPSYFPSGSPPDKWGPGVQIPVTNPSEYGFMDIPRYDAGSQEVEESVRRFADEYFGRPVDEQNTVQAQVMRQDMGNLWMHAEKLVDAQIFGLMQQFLPDEIFYRVVGSSKSQPLRTTREDIQGSFDVSISFNVGDLDNELVAAKLGLIEKALMMDTTGRVDRNNALDVIFELIDPDVGERVLKPAADASQAEIEDEQTVFAKLMAGLDVDVKPEGQAYDLRLKVLQNIFATNPKAQEAFDKDERVREVTEKRIKQLQFQLQQRDNAIIGRLGA